MNRDLAPGLCQVQLEALHHLGDEGDKLDLRTVDRELVHLNPRDLEQLIDEAVEPLPLRQRQLDEPVHGGGLQAHRAIRLTHDLQRERERRHGGAQLVGRHGQELVAQVERLHGLAVKAHVLDGERDPARELHGQIEIGTLIAPLRSVGAERDRPDPLASGDERHGHRGPRPDGADEPLILVVDFGSQARDVPDLRQQQRLARPDHLRGRL